jgi:hypothetical protein
VVEEDAEEDAEADAWDEDAEEAEGGALYEGESMVGRPLDGPDSRPIIRVVRAAGLGRSLPYASFSVLLIVASDRAIRARSASRGSKPCSMSPLPPPE